MSKVQCVHWILTPQSPNFNRFRSTASHCRDTGLSKVGMHRMTPRMTLITEVPKYPVYTGYSSPRPPFRSTTSHFRNTCLSKIGNAPNDPRKMTLSSKVSKVPYVHWILTPDAQISLRFALRPTVFEIQVFRKSKWTQWPQNDLNHWSIKSTLYRLNTHPRPPYFTPFRSTTSRFWGTGFSKIENAPNDPRMTLST